VDRRFVRELDDTNSGMSVAIVDPAGDYAATIVSGANLCLHEDDLDAPALWEDVALLILQNEVSAAINLAAARAARARGVRVILNSAPARDVAWDLRRLVDILIVNSIEAQMSGSQPVTDLPSALAAARHLASSYGNVVVTAGSKGLAAWLAEDGELVIPARKVTVVSSHGAGDCFTGALAAALAKGAGLADACRAGSEAAADHVSRRH
jgi:ribokinase